MHQIDIVRAFLEVKLDDEIYMQQLQGFVSTDHKDKVFRLNKALYGLKLASQAWNQTL